MPIQITFVCSCSLFDMKDLEWKTKLNIPKNLKLEQKRHRLK